MVTTRRYPLWFRQRVMQTPGTFKSIAQRWGISERTVRRWRHHLIEKGTLETGPFSPGRPRKLNGLHLFFLGLYKILFPGTEL
jgi:transposase-like protein